MYGKDVNMVATLGNGKNPIGFNEGESEIRKVSNSLFVEKKKTFEHMQKQ